MASENVNLNPNWGAIAGTAGINSGFNAAQGIFGSLIQGWQARKNAKLQQKYNQQNMLLQHSYEQENMQKQQEYWQQQFDAQNKREDYLLANQDALKVQSLRNAGLNPAFANGTQTLGQLSSPTAPSGGTSASASAGMAQAAMPMMGQLDLSQIQLNQATGEANIMSSAAALLKSFSDADLNPYRALEMISNALSNYSSANYNNQLAATVDMLRPYQVREMVSKVNLNDSQTVYNTALTKATLDKLPYEIQQTVAAIELTKQQSATEKQKRATLAAEAVAFFASADELASRANLNAANTNAVLIAANNAVIEGDIKVFERELWQHFPPDQRANYEKAHEIVNMGTSVISSIGTAAMGIGVGGKALGILGKAAPAIIGFR